MTKFYIEFMKGTKRAFISNELDASDVEAAKGITAIALEGHQTHYKNRNHARLWAMNNGKAELIGTMKANFKFVDA